MPTNMRGADPDQLDDLARLFERSADRIEHGLRTSIELADHLHWSGGDSAELRSRLRFDVTPRIDQVTELLRRQADRIRAQADEQRRVSGDTTVAPAPAPRPGPHPTPQPPIVVLPLPIVAPSPPPPCIVPVVGGGSPPVSVTSATAIGSLTVIAASFYDGAPWCGEASSAPSEAAGTCAPEPGAAVTATSLVETADAEPAVAPAAPPTPAPRADAAAVAVPPMREPAPPEPQPTPAVAAAPVGPSRWPLAAALAAGAGLAAGVAATAVVTARRPEPTSDPAVEAFFGPDPSGRVRP